MLSFLFGKKETITFKCSVRDLETIKRYVRDGFQIAFKGAVVILTKIVRV